MKLMALLPIVSVLFAAQTVVGMFAEPESVPVGRLIAKAESVLDADPKNAEAHYTLARVHYLAFVCGTKKLNAFTGNDNRPLPSVGPFQRFTEANSGALWEEAERRALREFKLKKRPAFDSKSSVRFWDRMDAIKTKLESSDWHQPDIPAADAASHIASAVEHFQTALQLAPEKPLYRLGYASLLEQAEAWARRNKKAEVPALIKRLTPASIREEYVKVWRMEAVTDLKERGKRGAFSPMDMVSYEAGKAFIRLAEKEGAILSGDEKLTLTRIHESLEELEKDTGNTVTPIVFTTRAAGSVDELLASDLTADFPLRGWGPDGHWPWVKADTAILVWNPSRSGHIASGVQLFGSYTWELFWKTGYEPLAVLDADGDGELRGPELDGLAAWFDRNGNGVSDPREVQPLRDIGVIALSTRAAGMEGRHPVNAHGITFSDGRVLPTWDWMVEPVDAPPMLSRSGD